MSRPKKALCVFCGSQLGLNPAFAQASRDLGTAMGQAGWNLVYGAGDLGLMGLVAQSAKESGAKVVGVIPQFLNETGLAHPYVDELKIVVAMHDRKKVMEELSDAFCILPGGYGTLDEMFEMVALLQLKQHRKPIVLFNLLGFYDPLQQQIVQMIQEGFIQSKYKDIFYTATTVSEVFDKLSLI